MFFIICGTDINRCVCVCEGGRLTSTFIGSNGLFTQTTGCSRCSGYGVFAHHDVCAYVEHERALMWKEGSAEGPEKGDRVNRSRVQGQTHRKMPETCFVFFAKAPFKMA